MRNAMLAVLMIAMVAAAQIPTSGLVARYDFTGGALTDGSGNSRTLLTTNPWGFNIRMPLLCSDRFRDSSNAYLWNRQYD
jgi:hypothetical protein